MLPVTCSQWLVRMAWAGDPLWPCAAMFAVTIRVAHAVGYSSSGSAAALPLRGLSFAQGLGKLRGIQTAAAREMSDQQGMSKMRPGKFHGLEGRARHFSATWSTSLPNQQPVPPRTKKFPKFLPNQHEFSPAFGLVSQLQIGRGRSAIGRCLDPGYTTALGERPGRKLTTYDWQPSSNTAERIDARQMHHKPQTSKRQTLTEIAKMLGTRKVVDLLAAIGVECGFPSEPSPTNTS